MSLYDINGNQLENGSSSSNCLNGKKLCCAGDSLTAGAGVGTVSKLTYGGICAELNNMIFTNAGANGATLSTAKPTNSFVTRYKNVEENDYLILWFGYNDFRYGVSNLKNIYCQETYSTNYADCTAEQKATCDALKDWSTAFVGDINGTDTATWLGSWNVVLNYYTKTYPDMHIGVILPIITDDKLKEPMREGLATICKKYGIPYIDSMNVNDWCCFGFTEGISEEMKNYYFTTRTGDGYLHPNERAYRIMANQLTEFLCRI